jgi:cytochrome bd-type quinol oxidase subunit 2
MGAKFEILFDVLYLISVVIIGIYIFVKSTKKEHRLFGIMAIILGLGDSFHLVPRILAIWNNNFSQFTYYLGFGEMVTSITMTIFYIILYNVFKIRYKKENYKKLDLTLYLLAAIRIVLSILPQNRWTYATKPYSWSLFRNIPFLIMGIIIIVLFIKETKNNKSDIYSNMPLAISLSFLFYIAVVLFAPFYPIVGALMLPKTLAYVWIVLLGLKDCKKTL